MHLNLEKMCLSIEESLSKEELDKITVHHKNFEQGVSYFVDGKKRISTIAFWPNGLCDVDSVLVETEKPTFKHYEFSSLEEAQATVLKSIKAAIHQAN